MNKTNKHNVVKSKKSNQIKHQAGAVTSSVSSEGHLTVQMSRSKREIFCGPLPPASEMQKYEDILPGAAERILKMAEREQRVTSKRENKKIRIQRLGMVLGFIALMAIIALAGVAVYWKEPWVAGAIVALAGVCSVMAHAGSDKKEN